MMSRAAHSLGHSGMTKTKQMLRQKYWFISMNKQVKHTVRQFNERQVTTKNQRKDPLIMTDIPEPS